MWRNEKESETEEYVLNEERQNWQLKGSEHQPDMSSRQCHLRTWWDLGLFCH